MIQIFIGIVLRTIKRRGKYLNFILVFSDPFPNFLGMMNAEIINNKDVIQTSL